jgi:6,7-dimethyl-8-ribityllumazine synthase|tara:strand:+ start:424 stop:849 length:426 start_codon:yes stop_codon:yes gene_type:complete
MKKILIINSNYYKTISDSLVKNAKNTLISSKLNFSINIINVPGIFEIPIAIRKNIRKFDGFIAIGCVIKGQTPHFDLICNSTFNSILKISVNYNKPIGNGIITALNMKQTVPRSKSENSQNKGKEAAKAVISILKNEFKKI